jgi:hypothetical protein
MEKSGQSGKKEREISTQNTMHTSPFTSIARLHLGSTLFFVFFHFSLILYFLNGCLDGLLVTQELVRSNSLQVLIQLQQNWNSSGKSDVDDVFI